MDLERKIMGLYNQEIEIVKQRKIINLLKVILVDKETNIDRILPSVPITYKTLKKYVNEKESLLLYLTEDEYKLFNEKIANIIESYERRVQDQELNDMRKVIDDIYNTRHKVTDIYSKNFVPRKKIDEMLKNNVLDIYFGEGTTEKLKLQIQKNKIIREKKARNLFLVEFREDIYFAKDELYYVDQFDYKRLRFASSYLSSGANLDYLIKKFDTNIPSIIMILSDPKLENLLKQNYYQDLVNCINIERLLVDSRVVEKKDFLFSLVLFLQQNNYDKVLAMAYFKTPVFLFDRVLKEILRMPYFDDKIKKSIQSVMIQEENVKVK